MPRHKATIRQIISAFLLVSNWAGWFESDMVGNPEDSFSRALGPIYQSHDALIAL